MTASLGLKNLDKVLWPETGFTKGQVLDYYREVAPALLPHLAGRPVVVRRFPDGVESLNWFQNELRGRPRWLRTAPIRVKSGAVQQFTLIDDLRSLLWVVNLASLELHPFLARADALDRPTAVVLDLDPGPPAGLLDCCRVALRLRDALGRPSFPKVSGGLGLHVYVPLETEATYAETRALARELASAVGAVDRVDHASRAGNVLLDWRQNDRMRQTIAAYSLRAAPIPTVSAPVHWEEVEEALRAARPELLVFEPHEVLERLERDGDLFAPLV